jgi:hypothetical protein
MNKPSDCNCDAATARAIAALINRFDRQCRDTQYTDTDEAWSLLRRIRQMLRPQRQQRRLPRVLTTQEEHTAQ